MPQCAEILSKDSIEVRPGSAAGLKHPRSRAALVRTGLLGKVTEREPDKWRTS